MKPNNESFKMNCQDYYYSIQKIKKPQKRDFLKTNNLEKYFQIFYTHEKLKTFASRKPAIKTPPITK